MRDLYYSEKENKAFYVSGYDFSSDNCLSFIDYLKTNMEKTSKLFGCKESEVSTYVVQKSSRYKYMRVWFANVETKPINSFEISDENGWTMDKWLVD